jgi:hypothetical protein
LLSNFDIEELCKEFKIPLVACVAKDILRKINLKNGGYVINLDDSTGVGSHWTGLYVKDYDCCYFDPFGINPPLDVLRFCKGKTLIINKDQIQKLDQSCCGYYCIAFLYYMHRAKGVNLRTNLFMFAKPFDLNNTTNNDNILQLYLKRMYKK